MGLMHRLQVIGWPSKKIRNRCAIAPDRVRPVTRAFAAIQPMINTR
jgi:hypothetical protein